MTNVRAVVPARMGIPDAVSGPRVVAIGRGLDPERVVDIGEGLLAGGVRAFEVTLNSASAFEGIAALVERLSGRGLVVGAGTVLDTNAAARAVDAGAGFIVSPHTDVELIEWAVRGGVPVFPGAFSPTEILAAWRAGATAVKLFPASAVGPTFVRELRGPLRDVPLLPTGGVTLETGPAFIEAGAVAVGLGSWLTGDGDPDGIAARGAQVVRALAAVSR